MIRVYPAESRFSSDHGWLQSNFSFSFGNYYDPDNTEFGPLCVFNDDTVAGHRGFGAHPHREMEIVSIVLRGQLQHEDSTGHKAVTGYGAVQRMSAGTGIIHSEVNPADEEVELLQIWIKPEERQLAPSYETSEYNPSDMLNKLLPVVSHQSGPGIAHIHQQTTLYLSELESGHAIKFQQEHGRRIYVFVIEGILTLNGSTVLNRRDAARITDLQELELHTEHGSKLLLIDLP